MKTAIKHINTLFLTLSIIFLSGSCTDPTDWYPEGSATIQTAYETIVSEKQCIYTIAISNTGNSKISRSTVSVRVETDIREYHTTIVIETGILPGGTVYTSAAVPYIDETETLAPNGVCVTGEFYE